MKVSICELPEGLSPADASWRDFAAHLERLRPDVAVLNELPFGTWLAAASIYDAAAARASIDAHERGLAACAALPAGAVVASRPVPAAGRLANEAFIQRDGAVVPVHHKQYFPQEPGFYEDSWFLPTRPGFDVVDHRGLRVGVLLCTELMFTEWARHYRRQGAHVILAPRAAGSTMQRWHTAAAMVAIVSGCYVLSSNRSSGGADAGPFGGRGFAMAPGGELIAETSAEQPVVAVDIDLERVARAQAAYPCYVKELASPPSGTPARHGRAGGAGA